jgi:hypothetical protein
VDGGKSPPAHGYSPSGWVDAYGIELHLGKFEMAFPKPETGRDATNPAKRPAKMGRPSPRQTVRIEAKRQIREALDSIPTTLKAWAQQLERWLAKQPGGMVVTVPVVEKYLRFFHRIAKRQKLLKSRK